jgi:hypothetical protein
MKCRREFVARLKKYNCYILPTQNCYQSFILALEVSDTEKDVIPIKKNCCCKNKSVSAFTYVIEEYKLLFLQRKNVRFRIFEKKICKKFTKIFVKTYILDCREYLKSNFRSYSTYYIPS